MSDSFGRRRTDRIRQRTLDDLIAREQVVVLLRQNPDDRTRALLEQYDHAEATIEQVLTALLEGMAHD